MWERGLLPRNTHFFHLYSDPVLRDLRSSLQPEQDAFKLDGSFLPLFFFHVLKSVRILDSNLKRDQRDTDFSASRLVDVAGECLGRKKEKKRD